MKLVFGLCLIAWPAWGQDVTSAHNACQAHLRAPVVAKTVTPVLRYHSSVPYTFQAADPKADQVYDAGWERCAQIETQWASSAEKQRIDAAHAVDAAKRHAVEEAAKP